MAQRVGAFFKRNWTLIAVGVPLGMGMEYLLVIGGFYNQLRKSKSKHIDMEWSHLDEEGKRAVLEVEERYRKIVHEREASKKKD